MEFQKINPDKYSEYEISFDDNCIVIKQGEKKVWINKSMAQWIALNFAKKVNIDISFIN